jgi:DUF3014 family protein
MMTVPSRALDPEPEFVVGDAVDATEPAGRAAVPARSSRAPIVAFIVLAALAGAATLYFFMSSVNAPAPTAATPVTSTSTVEQPEPGIRHPVGNIAGAPDAMQLQSPLPQLDDSDALAKDAIATIQNGETWIRLLIPDGIVRHIVATVDGLPQKTLAMQVRPIRSATGPLLTTTNARGMAIATDNAARYAPYLSAAEAIDTNRLTGFYVRLYPLFQQAYVELGYPKGYFNDRVIGVIDHLLAAPEPPPPVYLIQPRIFYEFADPALEELSAGQKLLVRVGLDNERRIKAKLRDIRTALAAEPLPR